MTPEVISKRFGPVRYIRAGAVKVVYLFGWMVWARVGKRTGWLWWA